MKSTFLIIRNIWLTLFQIPDRSDFPGDIRGSAQIGVTRLIGIGQLLEKEPETFLKTGAVTGITAGTWSATRSVKFQRKTSGSGGIESAQFGIVVGRLLNQPRAQLLQRNLRTTEIRGLQYGIYLVSGLVLYGAVLLYSKLSEVLELKYPGLLHISRLPKILSNISRTSGRKTRENLRWSSTRLRFTIRNVTWRYKSFSTVHGFEDL